MTLYLKYRPQEISQLDLEAVRDTLGKMLATEPDKRPHAWLFSGPRGTGKTSAARILAKAVNCESIRAGDPPTGRAGPESRSSSKKIGIEPCNECAMCLAITAGAAPDIVEIDAASNRGIDEIRDLREKVRLAPMQASFKVYIIDEVHMLTTEAANALLKTLEEPPGKTIFILCTTEAEKLPDTVVSRCTRVSFRKPTAAEAVSSLKRVTKGEKINADDKALGLIAKAAKGSFRDGTKILEQVLADQGEVSEKTVKQVLGMTEAADPEDFLELLDNKKTEEALKFIAGLDETGVNLRGFVERCVEQLREKMLEQTTGGLMAKYLERIEKFSQVYEQMKTAAVIQLPLEIMVIETGFQPGKSMAEVLPPKEKKETVWEKPEEKTKSEQKTPEVRGTYSLEDVQGKWGEIMKMVKPKNHSVEALLRSTRPQDFDGRKLTLEVFYQFHKEKLESEKCRQIVEEAVGTVFGGPAVKLYLTLGEKPKVVKADDNGAELVKAAEEIFK